eukprot:CAMPEP_0168166694 /NCGR_PEP_ID=MMETSP0139_2-20121125/2164_1 /TAXON_ID=44445 /ORGANISM="Pseudo-nitzschia australis, Strain 10249 10 AB" /LENGTH=146 /DNA_ID=CAMNT_0008083909 /DNA_START=239 /DNA_END=676 /DNA_ORIENTATION=-
MSCGGIDISAGSFSLLSGDFGVVGTSKLDFRTGITFSLRMMPSLFGESRMDSPPKFGPISDACLGGTGNFDPASTLEVFTVSVSVDGIILDGIPNFGGTRFPLSSDSVSSDLLKAEAPNLGPGFPSGGTDDFCLSGAVPNGEAACL